MGIHLTMKRLVLLSFVMSISSWTMPPAYAEGSLVEGAMILAPAGERGSVASAVDDTLKACLARIPDRAAPGQRTSAQQRCEEDEMTRKLVPPAPKF
jgi:hypothetical protein